MPIEIIKTGRSPVLPNQKRTEGVCLPKLGCVKAEGCSANFECQIGWGGKRLVRTATVVCGEVLPADYVNHYLLFWVDFLMFGILIVPVNHGFMSTCHCGSMLNKQVSSGVTSVCDICSHDFPAILMCAGHGSGFELLLLSSEVPPWRAVGSSGAPTQGGQEPLGASPEEATRMLRLLEHPLMWGQAEGVGEEEAPGTPRGSFSVQKGA